MARPTVRMLHILGVAATRSHVVLKPRDAAPLTVRGLLDWTEGDTYRINARGRAALADQTISRLWTASGYTWARSSPEALGLFLRTGTYQIHRTSLPVLHHLTAPDRSLMAVLHGRGTPDLVAQAAPHIRRHLLR